MPLTLDFPAVRAIPATARKPYSPPCIRRHRGGGGEGHERNNRAYGNAPVCAQIDGVDVAALAARFGSPLFVFSERVLRDTMRRAKDAFQSRYPNTQFAWSYKTNYLAAICAVFHSEGSIAEVVSGFEYEKARKLGVKGSDIVFNGPHKTRKGLESAIAEGALLQVDNWDELLLIESIAVARRINVPVALRVWLDAGIRPVWSKFGFGLETGDAWRAIKRIHAIDARHAGRLSLRGLHTHIGTYILEPQAYAVAADKLVTLGERARQEYGTAIEYVNLGGGFPSRATLHYSYAPAEQTVPPIERYAEAITAVLNALPRARRPKLILETGRALVDEAGYLIASVVAVKGAVTAPPMNLSGSAAKQAFVAPESAGSALVIDAGVNLLYTGAWYRFDVKPARCSSGADVSPVKLYGNLCMNIDVVREQVALPPQHVGDHLVLHPVGAYNLTQSMQFIAYRPAAVMIGLDGSVEVIRARETLEDVERPERLPLRLRRTALGFPAARGDGKRALSVEINVTANSLSEAVAAQGRDHA